jgi:hypothetical protein
MRKFTLLISLLVLTGMVFAQDVALQPCGLFARKNTVKTVKKAEDTKGQVIWSEDFNGTKWSATVTVDDKGYSYSAATALPAGWKVYDATTDEDNKPNGFFWHWSDVGPRGAYTGDANAFDPYNGYIDDMNDLGATASNGFFILESDFYNTTVNGTIVTNPVDMDSYVQYGPIDFSSNPYVEFNVNEAFRYCCSSSSSKLSLFLSTDYNPADELSAHWSEYDLRNSVDGNEYNCSKIELNVSKKVGGKSSVYFRIKQTAASHYFWMIDDISFTVPVENDLSVTDSWFDYLYPGGGDVTAYTAKYNFTGGYSNIPVQVLGDFVAFRAEVTNKGAAEQTFKTNVFIEKDGAKVYDEVSPEVTLSSSDIGIATIETAFTPGGKGSYQVSGSIVMDVVDANPSDNNFGYKFNVTDNYYSHIEVDNMRNWVYAGPGDWTGGGIDGDAIGQEFDLPADKGMVKIAGLRFYLPSYSNKTYWKDELDVIKAGNFTVTGHVWDAGTETTNPQIIASCSSYTISESDLGSWIYLPFDDDGNLYLPEVEGGTTILVGLEINAGNPAENVLNMSIAADNDNVKQPAKGGRFYSKKDSKWYITGDNYVIDLFLNEMPTIVTFHVDMTDATFDATTDVVYVTGSFADADGSGDGWDAPGSGSSVKLTDADADGIYSATVEVATNTTYEYKYFINAGLDGGEWAGDPNRKVVVAESNVTTDDIFGVKPDDHVPSNKLSAVKVYPNPFADEMRIENAKDIKSITVSNVVGQTVMVKTGITEEYTLNTSDLKSGIYFITFTDNNNNKFTVRRIKQ